MNTSLYQNIIKYSGPEKTTGSSGVIPIAVLKEGQCRHTSNFYLALTVRNLSKYKYKYNKNC